MIMVITSPPESPGQKKNIPAHEKNLQSIPDNSSLRATGHDKSPALLW